MASADFKTPLISDETRAAFMNHRYPRRPGLKLLWGPKWRISPKHSWVRGARIPGVTDQCVATIEGDDNGIWTGGSVPRPTWEAAAADAERRLFAMSFAVVELFTEPEGK